MLSFPDYRILLNDNDRIYAVLKKLRVFSRKVIGVGILEFRDFGGGKNIFDFRGVAV